MFLDSKQRKGDYCLQLQGHCEVFLWNCWDGKFLGSQVSSQAFLLLIADQRSSKIGSSLSSVISATSLLEFVAWGRTIIDPQTTNLLS